MNQLKELLKRLSNNKQRIIEYWKKTPSTKLIIINTGVYLMWKLDIIPEGFLVKHFSSQRYNLEGGRFHTLLTYSFSHTGIISLGFDILMLGFMGRLIQNSHGNKYIYWLYGLGALFGGITSSIFKLPSPYIQPQVGPESAIAAYVTFIGLLNPQQTFYFLFFPMRAWVLLMLIGTYSLLFDPKKKVFAGMTAGMTVHQMMRARFI